MNTEEYTIPRRPLIWLACALLFTVPPMFGNLAIWVPATFLAVLLVKLWMEWSGGRLRSIAWKIVFSAVALSGVYLTYHGLTGLEPGLSIYILLISLKILESHTARDFHVMALLGWFLSLAGLFISQDIGAGLYAAAAFCLVLAGVVQFHRGNASGGAFWPPLRASFALVLQALPLMLLLFFLFPRGSGPFRFELKRSFSGRTGMSDQLAPGSIASLAATTEVAFRVEFPDGNTPRLSDMYWRGGVLTDCDGLSWSHSPPGVLHSPSSDLAGPAIRQRIIMQPHGGQWVFALDWPAKEAPEGTRLLNGNVIRANKNIYSPRLYDVISRPDNIQPWLGDKEREACLRLPGGIPPDVLRLAESWKVAAPNPRAIVTRAMHYFHNENFRYSLSPGQYDARTGLSDFLFHRKLGFCEHYAAAFATLMRAAGIPSRVVMGYQGGQFNDLGGYLVVRQSDAHAWCEVWIPGSGWKRTDPTAAVAPGRVDLGFDSFMGSSAATGTAGTGDPHALGAWARQPLFRKIQLAWDTVSYQWESHVLNFDEDAQQTFFLNLGIIDSRPVRLLGWLLAAAAILLVAQSLWSWWKMRVTPDPVKGLYDRFCRHARVLGVNREPWEGPREFATRAARELPAHAQRISHIAGLYVALRYAPGTGDEADAFTEMAREIKAFGK